MPATFQKLPEIFCLTFAHPKSRSTLLFVAGTTGFSASRIESPWHRGRLRSLSSATSSPRSANCLTFKLHEGATLAVLLTH